MCLLSFPKVGHERVLCLPSAGRAAPRRTAVCGPAVQTLMAAGDPSLDYSSWGIQMEPQDLRGWQSLLCCRLKTKRDLQDNKNKKGWIPARQLMGRFFLWIFEQIEEGGDNYSWFKTVVLLGLYSHHICCNYLLENKMCNRIRRLNFCLGYITQNIIIYETELTLLRD